MARKRVLEKHIEKPVVKYARKKGIVVRKMNGLGNVSWPDQMFIGLNQHVLFVEFKRPRKTATPDQLLNHKMLKLVGFQVEVVDSIEQGIKLVDEIPCTGLKQKMKNLQHDKSLLKILKNLNK